MPFRFHDTLTLAAVLAIGMTADACAQQVVGPSGGGGAVTPSAVLAAPDSFLDSAVRVRGRVHVVRQDTLGPCGPATPAGCVNPASASLQLVTDGEAPGATTTLDLYRAGAKGVAEPVICGVIAMNNLDCGAFTPDTVMVVSGRVLKHRIPTQQVGTGAGEVHVIRSREIYVLLVRP